MEPALGKRVLLATRAVANNVSEHAKRFGWGDKHKLVCTSDMWQGLMALFGFKEWLHEPIKNDRNATALTQVLAGENELVKDRKLAYRKLSRHLTFNSALTL